MLLHSVPAFIGHWSFRHWSFSSWLLLEHSVRRGLAIHWVEAVFGRAGGRGDRLRAGRVFIRENNRRRLLVEGSGALGPGKFAVDVDHVGQAPVHPFGFASVEPLQVAIGADDAG